MKRFAPCLRGEEGLSERASLYLASPRYGQGVADVRVSKRGPRTSVIRKAWCETRVREAEQRLEAANSGLPSLLANHFPLIVEPTRMLGHPELAQRCGTVRTGNWHRRFTPLASFTGIFTYPPLLGTTACGLRSCRSATRVSEVDVSVARFCPEISGA